MMLTSAWYIRPGYTFAGWYKDTKTKALTWANKDKQFLIDKYGKDYVSTNYFYDTKTNVYYWKGKWTYGDTTLYVGWIG